MKSVDRCVYGYIATSVQKSVRKSVQESIWNLVLDALDDEPSVFTMTSIKNSIFIYIQKQQYEIG